MMSQTIIFDILSRIRDIGESYYHKGHSVCPIARIYVGANLNARLRLSASMYLNLVEVPKNSGDKSKAMLDGIPISTSVYLPPDWCIFVDKDGEFIDGGAM